MNNALKNKAWAEMASILDQEMPVIKPQRSPLFYWLIPVVVAVIFVYVWRQNSNSNRLQYPAKKESSSIIAEKGTKNVETSVDTIRQINASSFNKFTQGVSIVKSLTNPVQNTILSFKKIDSSLPQQIVTLPTSQTVIKSDFAIHPSILTEVKSKSLYNEDGLSLNFNKTTSEDNPKTTASIDPVYDIIPESKSNLAEITQDIPTKQTLSDTFDTQIFKTVMPENQNLTFGNLEPIVPVMIACCHHNKLSVFTEVGANLKNMESYAIGISYRLKQVGTWSFYSQISAAWLNMNLKSNISSEEIQESGISNGALDIFTADNSNTPYLDIDITKAKEIRLGLIAQKNLSSRFYSSAGIETVYRESTVELSALRNSSVTSSQYLISGQEISDIIRNKWDLRPTLVIGYRMLQRLTLETQYTTSLIPISKYQYRSSDRQCVRLYSLRLGYSF